MWLKTTKLLSVSLLASPSLQTRHRRRLKASCKISMGGWSPWTWAHLSPPGWRRRHLKAKSPKWISPGARLHSDPRSSAPSCSFCFRPHSRSSSLSSVSLAPFFHPVPQIGSYIKVICAKNQKKVGGHVSYPTTTEEVWCSKVRSSKSALWGRQLCPSTLLEMSCRPNLDFASASFYEVTR